MIRSILVYLPIKLLMGILTLEQKVSNKVVKVGGLTCA